MKPRQTTIRPQTEACIRALIGATVLSLLPASLFADQISDIVAEAEVRLPLKRGVAIGKIQERIDDVLIVKRRGDILFEIQIDQIAETPEHYFQEAVRLAEDRRFRRAAVQFGIARWLAPDNPDIQAFEPKILQGLAEELADSHDIRNQRLTAEASALEKRALSIAQQEYPELYRRMDPPTLYLPRLDTFSLVDLKAWKAMQRFGGSAYGQYSLARKPSSGEIKDRILAFEAVSSSLPDPAALRENLEGKLTTPEIAAKLFLSAAAGIWIDHLGLLQYTDIHGRMVRNYKAPIDLLREKARELLREQLLPTKGVRKVREGNFLVDQWYSIPPDPDLIAKMNPLINAPFAKEERKGTGFEFITTAGDSVFAPVENWQTFDNPKFPPDTPEQGFRAKKRQGYTQFQAGAKELILAWATTPEDEDLLKAMLLLQEETVLIFNNPPEFRSTP